MFIPVFKAAKEKDFKLAMHLAEVGGGKVIINLPVLLKSLFFFAPSI